MMTFETFTPDDIAVLRHSYQTDQATRRLIDYFESRGRQSTSMKPMSLVQAVHMKEEDVRRVLGLLNRPRVGKFLADGRFMFLGNPADLTHAIKEDVFAQRPQPTKTAPASEANVLLYEEATREGATDMVRSIYRAAKLMSKDELLKLLERKLHTLERGLWAI